MNTVTARVIELSRQLESYVAECALVESRLDFATGFGKTLTGEMITSVMSTTMMDDADMV